MFNQFAVLCVCSIISLSVREEWVYVGVCTCVYVGRWRSNACVRVCVWIRKEVCVCVRGARGVDRERCARGRFRAKRISKVHSDRSSRSSVPKFLIVGACYPRKAH